ncbi:MAG: ABC transporter transmembrane domain-containing protein, partial [Anaerolineales bacterium]
MAEFFRPYTRELVFISILIVIIALSSAAQPVLVSRGVDLLGADPSIYFIFLLAFAVFITGILVWGANWLRRRLLVRVIGDVVLNMRNSAFQAAAEHDLSFHDEFSSGRIVSRITSDTQDFGQVATLVTDLISQFLQAIILGIILLSIDLRLSLYLFALLPIIF